MSLWYLTHLYVVCHYIILFYVAVSKAMSLLEILS